MESVLQTGENEMLFRNKISQMASRCIAVGVDIRLRAAAQHSWRKVVTVPARDDEGPGEGRNGKTAKPSLCSVADAETKKGAPRDALEPFPVIRSD